MTQKRFSATQYALFSSLFGIPRLFGGPLAGFLVYGLGWTTFFWVTIAAGVPGLILLYRFVPIGVRDPHFRVRETSTKEPLGGRGLAWRGLLGGGAGLILSALTVAVLEALSAFRTNPAGPLRPAHATRSAGLTHGAAPAGSPPRGSGACGVIAGLLTAGRRGGAPRRRAGACGGRRGDRAGGGVAPLRSV